MKLTARLALSQLKVNKRRTTWTFLGIVLSTAMLTTIYNLGYGTGMSWVDNITYFSDLRANYFAVISGLAMTMSVFVIAISVIVISNAFRVSASERMAQFGILKSTGATKKQISQTVVYEGLYLTVIAIPVGILIGLAFQFISINLINDVIQPMLSVEDQASGNYLFEFILSGLGLFLAVGVSLMTVFLSAWLPARKAARVPAINAIRGTGEVKIKNKKVRGGRLVKKTFKTEGLLARTFLKRSSRNFRATVIAMSFSVAIFIIAGSFYNQMNHMINIQWEQVDANAIIRTNIETSEEVDCDAFDGHPDLSWIAWGELDEDGEWSHRTCYLPIDVNDVVRTADEFSDLHGRLEGLLAAEDRLFGIASGTHNHFALLPASTFTPEFLMVQADDGWPEQDYYELQIQFIMVDDAFAAELAELAGVEPGSNIVINHARRWLQDGRVIDFELFNFDYQTLHLSHWEGESVIENSSSLELHGQITPETRPSQLESGSSWAIRVVVPASNIDILRMEWFAQTEDPTRFIDEGRDLLFQHFEEESTIVNIWSVNSDAEALESRNLVGLVMFFMFSFIGVLILIGLTNVISTISENVKTRSKEFAVLQSVGMTSGGIKRMLSLESIFSSIHALAIGVPLGLLGSYGMHSALSNMGYLAFNPPWTWAVISIIAVFITTWLTMRYAANKLKNQNIIETIRSGSGM